MRERPACAGRAAALGLLATLVLASCGGLPETYYYTLRIPPPPATNDPKTRFVLGVERFRAREMLRDDRIVYYVTPTELNYYHNHRWSADPAAMLTDLTTRWLDEAGVFAAVTVLPTRQPVDYVLKGRVLNFEEVDDEAGGHSRVTLELMLVRTGDQRVVWSSLRQMERPVQQKGIAGVVKAMNDSSEALLREALPQLAAQIERDFKEQAPPAKSP